MRAHAGVGRVGLEPPSMTCGPVGRGPGHVSLGSSLAPSRSRPHEVHVCSPPPSRSSCFPRRERADAIGRETALGAFGVDLRQPRSLGQAGRRLRPIRQWQMAGQLPAQGLRERLRLVRHAQRPVRDRGREIIDELSRRTDLAPGSDEQKIRDYYASYMDQDARDAAGIKPLQPVLDRSRPSARRPTSSPPSAARTSRHRTHPSASGWGWIARTRTATSSAWASAA
jgi:hypothetical protein